MRSPKGKVIFVCSKILKKMKKEDIKIHIIGAGVSGLIAARVLEDNGFSPVIIEATERVGGRLKTDIIDGYQLDRGFQVLLTEYPAAKKYLNYDTLELQDFISGATIFSKGKKETIGNPLQQISLLFPTLFANIGSVSDKIKVLKLYLHLKKLSVIEIFEKPETTSLAYLQALDFSDLIINKFFKPFFSGIFLEPDLQTSSRMFEFVFKMFGEGTATLPKAGIEAIPRQLKANLIRTTFLLNTKVKKVEDHQITLENDDILASDYTIIATEAHSLISNLKNQEIEWKSCDTLYFETEKRAIDKPIIGLIVEKNNLINNIFYHNSLATDLTGKNELLSVTIVKKHDFSAAELEKIVAAELDDICGIKTIRCIKQYPIAKALPDLKNLHYEMSPTETRLTSKIFLAGDVQLNSSLNAAMLSGESAALGILEVVVID